MIQTLIVILILSYLFYFLMSLMPGDPLDLMISSNPNISSEDVARLKTLYGLDQPAWVRYLNWARSAIEGDFGYSRTYQIPVMELMAPRLINTAILSLSSLLLSLFISIPLGIYCALKPNSKIDYAINLFSFAGISIPSFWLAIVLIIFFAVKLPWFPAGGTETVDYEAHHLWELLLDRGKYLALPVLSLSLQQIGRFSRYTRSSMREVLQNDYIKMAKAKGLNRSTIIWKHAFKNALIPLITILALSFSSLFSGALLTETVFAYQGIGKLVYDSIISNDYNVAMVSLLISITMVLMMNLFADILYSFVDPRISIN